MNPYNKWLDYTINTFLGVFLIYFIHAYLFLEKFPNYDAVYGVSISLCSFAAEKPPKKEAENSDNKSDMESKDDIGRKVRQNNISHIQDPLVYDFS